MQRLTITIDARLLASAQKVTGLRTKTATIRQALEELVRRKKLKKVLSHQGKVELNLTQKTLSELRERR